MVACVLLILVFVTIFWISDGARDCPLIRLPADTSDGYLTFPNEYNKRMTDCRWIIEARRDEWTVKIQVLKSDLDQGTSDDCRTSESFVELLEMPKKSMYGIFCGEMKPTFYSTSKRVLIKFKEFSSLNNNLGFKLKYSAGNFGSIGDETIATSWYIAQKDPLQIHQPEFFSQEYPRFVRRAWLIGSDDPEQEIYVRALSLSFPDNCVYDFIQLFHGKDKNSPPLGKWCGTDKPDKVVVRGNIYIVLHVRNFDIGTSFEIEYGKEVKSAIPMIAGIFVGVIAFIGLVFIGGKMICSRYMNNDDSDDESEAEPTPANQTLLIDVTTRDDPPPFSSLSASAPPYSELSPPLPTAPPADVSLHPPSDQPSMPPPSYEEVVNSPLSYKNTSNH